MDTGARSVGEPEDMFYMGPDARVELGPDYFWVE